MESIIFSIDGHDELFDNVIKEIYQSGSLHKAITNGAVNVQKFSDGELCVDFVTSVRGKRVYLLSSPNDSDKIIQLNLAIDAAKRAGAAEIIPILPYFPYARQDKKDQVRGPIGAKVMAEMLEQRGATQIITFDLHADQIQGFFNIPVVHMEGKYLFDRYVYDVCVRGDSVRPDNVNVVLCAPDAGAAKRVKHFRDQVRERWQIDLPMVMIDKTRPRANEVGEMVLIGDVKGKSVIIIDDMCDTGGTLVKAASELLKEGAESVRAIVTHGVLSGPALSRIWDAKQDGVLSDFVCSDSLPVSNRVLFLEQGIYPKANDYITVISTAKQIVKAIKAINDNRSVEVLKHVG